MSISKQFQHFHQEDLGRKVDEIIDTVNNNTSYRHNISLSYGDDGDYTLSALLEINVISRDSAPYDNGTEISNKLPCFNEIGSYTSQSGSGFVLFWSEDRSLPKAYKITIAGSTFTKVELTFRAIHDSVTALCDNG
jgi:hypothetical protein